jgi:hypothetical protein
VKRGRQNGHDAIDSERHTGTLSRSKTFLHA